MSARYVCMRKTAAGVTVLKLHAAGDSHSEVLRSREGELDFQQRVTESHAT